MGAPRYGEFTTVKTDFSSASSSSSERGITKDERLQDRSQPSHELSDWTRV